MSTDLLLAPSKEQRVRGVGGDACLLLLYPPAPALSQQLAPTAAAAAEGSPPRAL